MKKINMLKFAISVFRTSIVIVIAFCLLISFVRIKQSITINGIFWEKNNEVVCEFTVLNNGDEFLNVGSKITLVENLSKLSYEGVISKKEYIDIGLQEGKIIKYEAIFSGVKVELDKGKYYSCYIYNNTSKSLLSIIMNNT